MSDETTQRRFCPKCRRSTHWTTTNDVAEILRASCGCGWSGELAQLTATSRTIHLRPPLDHHVEIETSVCGWLGVELSTDLALVQCRSCRRRARPPKERVVARPIAGTMHFARERLPGEGLDAHPTLCGATGETTTDAGLVRCKRCRRAMDVTAVADEPQDPSPDPLPFEPGPPVPVKELGGAIDVDVRDMRIIERSHAGDDESDRPRWRSLESAIEKTSAIKAGRSPMRSGWKVEQESRSEGAVRTEHGRDEVIEIDRAFARAFTRPIRIGGAGPMLTREQASSLLEEVLRGYSTAEQIASDLTDDEHVVTRHEVGLVIKAGKAAMRELLERKGLIERRRTREAEEAREDTMAAPAGFDLDGWKAILPLIGMTEATARERMVRDDDPLPITPWSGRVIGVRAELEAWVRREAAREREARRKSA